MSTTILYSGTITGAFRLPLTEAADLDGQKEVSVTYVVSDADLGGATNFNIKIFHAPRNNASHYSESHVTESGTMTTTGVKNSYITQFSRFLTLKVEWSGSTSATTAVDLEVLLVPKA